VDPAGTLDMCLNTVPSVITYPKYFISNGDRTVLMQSGTMCGAHSKEPCQDVLPYDGHFVWRVGGYGNANAGWNFCGVSGTVGQELQFEMRNGKCVAHQLLSADDYCSGVVSLALLEGKVFLQFGASNPSADTSTAQLGLLSHAELKIVENTIANIFGDAEMVSVKSVSMDAGAGGIDVYFSVTEVMETKGFVGTYYDNVEAFESFSLALLDGAITPGYFVVSLQSALSSLDTSSSYTEQGLLSSVQSATILSLTVVSVKCEVKAAAPAHYDPSSSSSQNISANKFSHMSIGAIAAVAVLCAVVIVAGGVVLFSEQTKDALPSDSESHLMTMMSERGYGASLKDVGNASSPYEARSDDRSFFRGRPI
jgi:hypothetical protein